jgi:hypothetical protein
MNVHNVCIFRAMPSISLPSYCLRLAEGADENPF